jgi:Uma2 family endonuclease
MLTDLKYPLTNADLTELADEDGFYRFPASLDEYWQVLADAEYRADYFDHQIIATMSYESDIHSRLATEFSFILRLIYRDKPGFVVYNSNRPVYLAGCSGSRTGVFNADGMVVALPRQPYEYQPGLSAETTPTLLIEILSPSTAAYDFATKLPCYKEAPSVQTVLFVKQDKPEIIVMERQSPNQWQETWLRSAEETFTIAGEPVSLKQVYRDVFFDVV